MASNANANPKPKPKPNPNLSSVCACACMCKYPHVVLRPPGTPDVAGRAVAPG